MKIAVRVARPGALHRREVEFDAINIDPNSLDAHYVYALLLMALGRLPEAIEHIDVAAEMDPLSAQVQSTYGRVLYRARHFDEAVTRLNRAIELEPRNSGTYSRLGDVYDQIGRHVEALALYGQMPDLASNSQAGARVRIARTYARMGRRSESRQVLGSLRDHRSAEVYAVLGDADMAFALLFESIEERNNWNIYIKADPPFDSLHADPRWNEMLRRMNLPVESGASEPMVISRGPGHNSLP